MIIRELAKLCIMVCSKQIIIINFFLFRNRPPDVDINLFINNERITRVRVNEIIGVFIDDDLN